LDKATLTLGDNRRVNFSRCVVIMTSNLGAREMAELIGGGIGFAAGKGTKTQNEGDVDQQIYRTAVEAARRKFTPEFMNRIDKVVCFRSLKENHLRKILDLELQAVQERVMFCAGTKFVFECSPAVKDKLLREGFDFRYGARHLKRAVERLLVSPLSNLVASEQVEFGDFVYVDLNAETGRFTFAKRSGGALVGETNDLATAPESDEEPHGGVGVPFQQAQVATQFIS
jgi:ATP-dependent Clp protease ATP-binding subunit ClpB